MIRIIKLIIVLLILGNNILLAQNNNDPVKNFEVLWNTFDTRYGNFLPKRVDWDLLYKVYRPKITNETTDDELFDIMTSMLGHLNDNHVSLVSNTRSFNAGILENLKNEGFSKDLIKRKYLGNKFKHRAGLNFTYGWLSETIGYFHFSRFSSERWSARTIDAIVEEFKNSKGIVMDIRNNGGGSDNVGNLIANRFTDKKRHYMSSQIRNGSNHYDFTSPRFFYVEPDGPIQYTKPIVLLTNQFSVSAAETFTWAMRVLPHVTSVGEPTSGCYADKMSAILPNGWKIEFAHTLFVDQNGFSWEGMGIPANLRVVNTKEDIEQDRDKPLELAIELINSGALKNRNKQFQFPIK